MTVILQNGDFFLLIADVKKETADPPAASFTEKMPVFT
jgi:hypothetical protein